MGGGVSLPRCKEAIISRSAVESWTARSLADQLGKGGMPGIGKEILDHSITGEMLLALADVLLIEPTLANPGLGLARVASTGIAGGDLDPIEAALAREREHMWIGVGFLGEINWELERQNAQQLYDRLNGVGLSYTAGKFRDLGITGRIFVLFAKLLSLDDVATSESVELQSPVFHNKCGGMSEALQLRMWLRRMKREQLLEPKVEHSVSILVKMPHGAIDRVEAFPSDTVQVLKRKLLERYRRRIVLDKKGNPIPKHKGKPESKKEKEKKKKKKKTKEQTLVVGPDDLVDEGANREGERLMQKTCLNQTVPVPVLEFRRLALYKEKGAASHSHKQWLTASQTLSKQSICYGDWLVCKYLSKEAELRAKGSNDIFEEGTFTSAASPERSVFDRTFFPSPLTLSIRKERAVREEGNDRWEPLRAGSCFSAGNESQISEHRSGSGSIVFSRTSSTQHSSAPLDGFDQSHNGDEERQGVYSRSTRAQSLQVSGSVARIVPLGEDYRPLMELYNRCGGPQWKNQRGWGSSEPLGKWHGVMTNKQGRVVSIALPKNNLSGILPDVLCTLSDLQVLSIPSNPDLIESLPQSIGELKYLYKLDLTGNVGMIGKIPESVLANAGLRLLIGGTGLLHPLVSMVTPSYGIYMIPTIELISMTRLIPHEQALEEGKIWEIHHKAGCCFTEYTSEKVANITREECAFVSHRWLCSNHPDDEKNSKLKHLQLLCQKYHAIRLWWIDYMCVPQEQFNVQVQPNTVYSLPHYVKCCASFFILTCSPKLPLNNLAHFWEYQDRGWCRYECLAAFCPVWGSLTKNLKLHKLELETIVFVACKDTGNEEEINVKDMEMIDIPLHSFYQQFSASQEIQKIGIKSESSCGDDDFERTVGNNLLETPIGANFSNESDSKLITLGLDLISYYLSRSGSSEHRKRTKLLQESLFPHRDKEQEDLSLHNHRNRSTSKKDRRRSSVLDAMSADNEFFRKMLMEHLA